jgi:hypothetical protein
MSQPRKQTEDEGKAMSRDAAKRLHRYAMENDLSPQVLMDLGILIGRLSFLEGPGWLKEPDDD